MNILFYFFLTYFLLDTSPEQKEFQAKYERLREIFKTNPALNKDLDASTVELLKKAKTHYQKLQADENPSDGMVQKVAYIAPPPIKKGKFIELATSNINDLKKALAKITGKSISQLLSRSEFEEGLLNTFGDVLPIGKVLRDDISKNLAGISDAEFTDSAVAKVVSKVLDKYNEKVLKAHYLDKDHKAIYLDKDGNGIDVSASDVTSAIPVIADFITASESGLNKISPADTKTIAEFVSKVGAISVDLKNGLNIYEGKTFAVKKKELYDNWKSLFSKDTNGAVFGDLLAVVNNFPQETIPVQELVSAIKAILASKFDNKTLGVKAGACVNCLAVSTSVDGKALAALLETYKAEK